MSRVSFIFMIAGMLSFHVTYPQLNAYPVISKSSVKEKIHDTIVVDDYRNFEDFMNDSAVIEHYNKQNQLADSLFLNNSLTDKYEKYLRDIDKNENDILYGVFVTKGGEYFYEKRTKGDLTRKLFYRTSLDSTEKELFNPKPYRFFENKRYRISSFKPSWDGSKVAIGIRGRGEFTSEIIILDVKSGKIQETGILNTRPNEYFGLNWIPGKNAFTYTSLRTTDSSNPEIKLNTSLVIYDVDTKQSKEIFGNGNGPETDKRLFPVTKIFSENDKYLVVYVAGPSRNYDSYYISYEDLYEEKLDWKELFKIEDKEYSGTAKLKGGNIYYLSGLGAENHKIIVRNLKTGKSKVLVDEIKDEVIRNLQISQNDIYFNTSKFGNQSYVYQLSRGELKKLNLPIEGSKINLDNQSIESPNIWINIEGPLSTKRRFHYDSKSNRFTEEHLYNPPNVPEFEGIIFKTVEVKSHDGAMVPMTIVHQKGIKLNSNNPVLSQSYGAFGSITKIEFQTHMLSYVSLGGILVYPHIRGGGAKGEEWHKAGMKTTKSNSWKDLIACMNYLVENKYTTSSKIALFGKSAGAIPIAMAINEKPDLVGAVIINSGVLNPFRKPDVYKATSFLEYGSKDIKEEAKGLVDMDPFLNIPMKANFPAIYVWHGFKDDRVYLHEPLKYITRIQESNIGDKLTILDIDFKGTHTSSSSFYKKYARIFSFAFKHTGHSVNL